MDAAHYHTACKMMSETSEGHAHAVDPEQFVAKGGNCRYRSHCRAHVQPRRFTCLCVIEACHSGHGYTIVETRKLDCTHCMTLNTCC